MIKKYFVLIAVLSLLTGCQPNTSSVSPSQNLESSSMPESSSSSQAPALAESSQAPQNSSSSSLPSSQPVEKRQIAGSYVPKEDLGMYQMQLRLGEDENFILEIKAMILSGTVEGSYHMEGEMVTLKVTKAELPGFSIENTGELKLTVQENGSLLYQCDDFLKQAGITNETITFVTVEE